MSRQHPTPAERLRLRAAQRRYEQTPKGKACLKRYCDKRIWIGRGYPSPIAASAEEAKAIEAHINRRKRDFQRQQSREKAEGV